MLERIRSKGPEGLKAVEVTLYKEEGQDSAFDNFSRIESVEEFQTKFNINLGAKQQHEPQDILRFIREKLFYYKKKWAKNISMLIFLSIKCKRKSDMHYNLWMKCYQV